MFKRALSAVAVSALMICSASGQDLKTKQFIFSSVDSAATTRQERYCLPANESLVAVNDIQVFESNAKAAISVAPDVSSNCVKLTVQLPPAASVCTDVPRITGFQITMTKQCNTVPTVVNFALKYQAAATAAPPR